MAFANRGQPTGSQGLFEKLVYIMATIVLCFVMGEIALLWKERGAVNGQPLCKSKSGSSLKQKQQQPAFQNDTISGLLTS
jgi:hypothetical protein